MKRIVLLALVAIGFATGANAQATATATATAIIITPITITKQVDMHFGNVAVTSTSGSVTMDPAGNRTPNGGVTLPVVNGPVAAASFDITGEPNYTYAITLPSAATTLTNATAQTMTVDQFTSSPTPTGTLSAAGTETVTVGATLNVAAAQAAGTYVSGTPFDVTVNYN